MLVRFEMERTHPLEQFANTKPKYIMEIEVADSLEADAMFNKFEDMAILRMKHLKKKLFAEKEAEEKVEIPDLNNFSK